MPVTHPQRTLPPLPDRQGDKQLLAGSLDALGPHAVLVAPGLYRHLFAEHPQYAAAFDGHDMAEQHHKLTEAVIALVHGYDNPRALLEHMTTLGRLHQQFDLEHFLHVREALFASITDAATAAGVDLTAGQVAAWRRAYRFAAAALMLGPFIADVHDDQPDEPAPAFD